MIRKTPYPTEKLILNYQPINLTKVGGTIETAVFQEPKLLEYMIKFPKGFKFPPGFHKINNNKDETTLTFSENHSGKNEIIFTGLSSTLYSRLKSKDTTETRLNVINTYRFQVLLEQQSIISLVSILETFMKSVQNDHSPGNTKFFYHEFKKVKKALVKCGIILHELGSFRDKKTIKRTEEIINYAFNLRNLFVQNGGIVDKSFYEKYKDKIPSDNVGKLIRIEYNDYVVIRQWLSFFIQEICRVIEGYDDVWTDYLLSTGIVLPDYNLNLKADNGDEFNIPLEDGVELIGRYEDESVIGSEGGKLDDDNKTYEFKLDIGKLIENKRFKTQ